ncbi:adenylyltransferase/cytidyltransferase family protein [Tepidibacillus infernus]|uniref:adenylyltransferase/cytidyltransferase family protein n=1 Tax=Tepidibacillus infernus TaxID=1806172 RepID=UPI003B759BF9
MNNKLLSLDEIEDKLKFLKDKGKKIVHCHGVFDLFHIGHLKHLKAAKEFGDILIVSVTADIYVNKGPERPAFNEKYRAEILTSLEIVDYVIINEWPSAVEILQKIKPHYYVKGSDYKVRDRNTNNNIFIEEETCQRIGTKMVYTDEYSSSSTKLLNKYFHLV